MKITLITVGKIKEKYLKDAIAEYSKRLGRYCKLEIVEVADEKTPDHASETVEKADIGGRVGGLLYARGARELIDFSRADAAYHHVALSDKG